MPWKMNNPNPEDPGPPPQTLIPIHVIPFQPVPQPSPTTAFLQAIALPQALEVVNMGLKTMQILAHEETRRQEIQANKEIALASIEAGRHVMSQLVNREYDNRDLAVKEMAEIMKTMTMAGHPEAALELGRALLEKKLDSQFVRDLLAFRAQHASAGFIDLEITNPPSS
jgi:hypothetical protein